MRALILRKIFFSVTSLIFVLVSLTYFSNYPNLKYNKTMKVITNSLKDYEVNKINENNNSERSNKEHGFKYILQWTSPKNVPFNSMGVGQDGFTSRNCTYTNCFVSSKGDDLHNVTDYDVIAFSGPEVVYYPVSFLPQRRSPNQKYVFASIESSGNYPVCSNRFDGYFNWTWTFRLDSDVRWGYMVIRDSEKKIIGPNKIMHWLKDMTPVSQEFKLKLKSKTKAVAWFVSNCIDELGRLKFAQELEYELIKYKLELDIYGECGKLSCPRSENERCMKMLEQKYYFYLSFENSYSEDYVTEKLLIPLQNNVVPIVFGWANYTRFMPKGIYLDARKLGVQKLATRIAELIKDPEQYANLFRWKNHYSYHGKHESPETDEYCQMCALLNNEEKFAKTTIVKNFQKWWDNPSIC